MTLHQNAAPQIQCTSCYAAYHPLCGRLAGLHMNIDEGAAVAGGPDVGVRLVSYCARHCTPHPELSGACGATSNCELCMYENLQLHYQVSQTLLPSA